MKNKFKKFINGNGFLVFLFICVCIVSFSTIFMLVKDTNDFKKDKQKESYKESLGDQETKIKDILNEEENEEKTNLIENNQEEEADSDKEEEMIKEEIDEHEGVNENNEPEEDYIETSNIIENKLTFIMPLKGEIITEFTKDSLIYSKTLEEWRAHPGLDIKGNIGSKVVAAADGIVEQVYKDPLWGNIVLINHGNGFKTKYANLDTDIIVETKQKVKQGETIAKIGKSATIEVLMDDHLHFELISDGKYIDPRSIN